MAKVLGVGGVFFTSPDPQRLYAWYARWLGVDVSAQPGVLFLPGAMPEGGGTVWSIFPETTDYFAPSKRPFMFNLVVDDLEGALRQVREGGAEVVDTIERFDYGSFGWFLDPDGNKVELWQPATGSHP